MIKGKINWIEFIIDCGDTLGGIGIGIATQKDDSMVLLAFSVVLVILSTTLKFRKHKI